MRFSSERWRRHDVALHMYVSGSVLATVPMFSAFGAATIVKAADVAAIVVMMLPFATVAIGGAFGYPCHYFCHCFLLSSEYLFGLSKGNPGSFLGCIIWIPTCSCHCLTVRLTSAWRAVFLVGWQLSHDEVAGSLRGAHNRRVCRRSSLSPCNQEQLHGLPSPSHGGVSHFFDCFTTETQWLIFPTENPLWAYPILQAWNPGPSWRAETPSGRQRSQGFRGHGYELQKGGPVTFSEVARAPLPIEFGNEFWFIA